MDYASLAASGEPSFLVYHGLNQEWDSLQFGTAGAEILCIASTYFWRLVIL